MFDPADLELIRGISLTYELEIVHASFNVMCRSLDLPLICGSLHDFEPRRKTQSPVKLQNIDPDLLLQSYGFLRVRYSMGFCRLCLRTAV